MVTGGETQTVEFKIKPPRPKEVAERICGMAAGTGPGTTGALNHRQLVGLQIVQQRGSISSGEYQADTGAHERTARRDLGNMANRGILTTRGKTKSLRYFLP